MCSWFVGQTQENGDTTIYQIVEQMPRFPICEILDTTVEVKKRCAEEAFLAFMYENIRYPIEAMQQNLEGTVVVSFVVEKSGHISQPGIVKDIGGGCAAEALRVVEGMREMGMRWVPGMREGDTVRVKLSIPLRFRIEEPLPYTLINGDTIYTNIDTFPQFISERTLQDYFLEKLDYPEEWKDSCKAGILEAQVLIRKDGSVKVMEIIDMNELGYSFWDKAITACVSTYGSWKPARFEGQNVPYAINISVPFIPNEDQCKDVASNFNKARQLENEARALLENEQEDEALGKLAEAIALSPRDASLHLMRGEIYLNKNDYEGACSDIRLAREIASADWYEELLTIFCRK